MLCEQQIDCQRQAYSRLTSMQGVCVILCWVVKLHLVILFQAHHEHVVNILAVSGVPALHNPRTASHGMVNAAEHEVP